MGDASVDAGSLHRPVDAIIVVIVNVVIVVVIVVVVVFHQKRRRGDGGVDDANDRQNAGKFL